MFTTFTGVLRLPIPRVLPEPSSRIRIGHIEELAVGTRRIVPQGNMELISTEKGIAAISLVCTHLGCIVSPTEEGYICPCHGSAFGTFGEVLRGPAPRGLRWLALTKAPDGSLVAEAKREVPANTFFKG
jgi:cytochrome b6-f complex iron-sulfur subunit